MVGNPPYVRQELLGAIKPYLQDHYQTYHGMADLYVYFYERGVEILRPGGRLAFVVTNKWMKAGYAEPLRKFFGEKTWVEQVVDFGHAKQFFLDADVFPCFLVVRKPCGGTEPQNARVCVLPRDTVRVDLLRSLIEDKAVSVRLERLNRETWSLEPEQVADLIDKIRNGGVPLSERVGAKPLRGIISGFNDAFLIDDCTKRCLIERDARAGGLIKPYLRGQDIDRWSADWRGLWMIAIKSSNDHSWPWSALGEPAELEFGKLYPSIYSHLCVHKPELMHRLDKGRYWWELRSCSYWEDFDRTKVMYQDITWTPSFCLDTKSCLSNNTVYFLPRWDYWTLSVLNSAAAWWFSWRVAQHGKDEALRFFTSYLESFPIPNTTDTALAENERLVRKLVQCSEERVSVRNEIQDWLKVQHQVERPSTKLQDPSGLDSDAFVSEVQKAQGKKNPLTAAGLRSLRDEHTRTIEPARLLASEALQLVLNQA